MTGTFLMVSMCSITMQSLGKIVIVQHVPAVGVKIWCLYVLSCSESGALCIRGVHSSNKHCIVVYGSILMRFSAFLSQMHYTFPISIA